MSPCLRSPEAPDHQEGEDGAVARTPHLRGDRRSQPGRPLLFGGRSHDHQGCQEERRGGVPLLLPGEDNICYNI